MSTRTHLPLRRGLLGRSPGRDAPRRPLLALVAAAVLPLGCAAGPIGGSDDLQPVPFEESAPALEQAFRTRSPELDRACARTIAWLDAHPGQADAAARRATLARMRILIARAPDAASFVAAVRDEFEVLRAPGRDGAGTVQFTAYYAPELEARRERDAAHAAPLHRRPDALPPGNPQELPWFTRAEIREQGLLDDRAIAWLDPLDAYLAQVNGSARLRFDDGSVVALSHDGTNGRPYTSLGKMMVEERLLPAGGVTMQSIRAAYVRNPERVVRLFERNERTVFFEAVDPAGFPRSGLGIALLPETAVATDKAVFAGGDLMLVSTIVPDAGGDRRPFDRLVIDQDMGGAIRGPGRADLFLGVGSEAGERAGRMNATGRLYVLRYRGLDLGPD